MVLDGFFYAVIPSMLLSSSVIVSAINSFGSVKPPSTHIETTAGQPIDACSANFLILYLYN